MQINQCCLGFGLLDFYCVNISLSAHSPLTPNTVLSRLKSGPRDPDEMNSHYQSSETRKQPQGLRTAVYHTKYKRSWYSKYKYHSYFVRQSWWAPSYFHSLKLKFMFLTSRLVYIYFTFTSLVIVVELCILFRYEVIVLKRRKRSFHLFVRHFVCPSSK